MEVVSKGYDTLLEAYNLLKKNREINFDRGENQRVNRYLKYQMQRLRGLKNQPTEFWKLAELLLRHSKCFRMLALRNVRPNWYKDYKLSKILRSMKVLNGICNRPRRNFEITRTGIPKPDGGIRYINDPGISWRCYLWIINCMLNIYLEDRLNSRQFGHRKGKGTIGAWKEILNNFSTYKYIYEFDFKKFHDNIERSTLIKAMKFMDIPENWIIKLGNLNAAYIKRCDKEDPMRKEGIHESWNHQFHRGVVQGSNIAGLCGLMALEYMKVYDIENGIYIGYADDGIIMTNCENDVEQWKGRLNSDETGVEIKEEKSGWVRKDEWITDLKFVGASLNGKTKELEANTHSGKKWRFEWNRREDFLQVLTKAEFEGGTSNRKLEEWLKKSPTLK